MRSHATEIISKQIGWFAVLIVTGLTGRCFNFPDFYFEMPAMPVKSLEPLVDEKHAVSDPEEGSYAAEYPARTFPCQRFDAALASGSA